MKLLGDNPAMPAPPPPLERLELEEVRDAFAELAARRDFAPALELPDPDGWVACG